MTFSALPPLNAMADAPRGGNPLTDTVVLVGRPGSPLLTTAGLFTVAWWDPDVEKWICESWRTLGGWEHWIDGNFLGWWPLIETLPPVSGP